jgi:hypothetical protein
MSWISDIEKIDFPKIAKTIALFMATIAPGFLILYLFKHDLIANLDIIKLIIFSFSLTLPLLIFNWFSVLAIIAIYTDTKNHDVEMELGSITVNIMAYYLAIFIAYLYALPFRSFVWILLGINFFILFILLFIGIIIYVREKKSNRNKVISNAP